MIKPSKIFEVFESQEGRKKRLYTRNLVPTKNVYGERLVKENNTEYREWDASKSKLAASILKGSLNICIRKNDVVLYLGSASGTTVSHVSDILGNEGFIFAVDLAPRVMRDLIFLCYQRKNIAPILADANKIKEIQERISEVDVIYQDIAQKDQTNIFLKNIDLFLKHGGYAILAVKARSIDVTKKPAHIFKEVREKLEKTLTIIDYRELDPFQKDHCFFICKKR
ncbi:fibrillarin [Candidatus Woesearchaeota archaeon]|jgi:fibrillarin-like pre-rRNA processing protein|nr:fibrillarin [Candidatus Woesearchaeota archaeon]MDP6648466.1 fibrillarin-like rRNA/tRNA 2'-O-methyltransferase [Candidatus Woesearchaeota archaeon]|tara:strand:+ start:30336 stop:31010 length:675 start_codon:yes stop_codon:yes gene_type:complete